MPSAEAILGPFQSHTEERMSEERPLLPSHTPSRGSSWGLTPSPQRGLPELSPESVPEPQISEACPPQKMEGVVQAAILGPSQFPEPPPQEIPTVAIDLSGGHPLQQARLRDPVVEVQIPTKQVGSSSESNSLYLLIGVAFIGIVIWMGDEQPRGVMPYYN